QVVAEGAPNAVLSSPQPAGYVPECMTFDCNPCCDCPRVWGRMEALLWWVEGTRTPPLAIDGSTPPRILFGAERLNDSVPGGVRTTLGTWFGDDCCLGLQGSYFFLGPDHSFHSAGSPTIGAVNRPFISANGQLAVEFVPGTVVASSSTTGLMGADALLRYSL